MNNHETFTSGIPPANQRAFAPRAEFSAPSFSDDDNAEGGIDLRQIWETLWRHKIIILVIALLVFSGIVIKTLMTPPSYQATAKIQLEDDTIAVLNYDVQARQQQTTKDFYETQYELLKSRSLARRTIDELDLYPNPDAAPEDISEPTSPSLFEQFKNWIQNPSTASGETPPTAKKLGVYPDEDRFLNGLSVTPVKNSRLVLVSYTSTDPQLAAKIVNTLTTNFISINMERRGGTTTYAKKFLDEQLTLARSRLEESEAELVLYTKQQDLVSTDDNQSLASQKLGELHTALSAAERDRIAAENDHKQAYSGNSGVAGDINGNPVVGSMKNELAKLKITYQEKSQVYKSEYPEMIELQSQIQQLEEQINKENQVDHEQLKARFLAAKGKEQALHKELEKQKLLLLDVRDKSIRFNTLKRDVETNRILYEGLLQRIKEVGVAGGASTNNITVIDPALVPYAQHSPDVRKNLLQGILLGLLIGVAIAFLIEFLDDRIKSAASIEKLSGLPILGTTPALKSKDVIEHSLATALQPTSGMAEAFRSLRTNLLFATRDGLPNSLLVTSSAPSEAKSSSCINLASALAQAGKRVLLIDADLRKPTIHQRFKLDNSQGLSSYLTHQADALAIMQETTITGVTVITAGPLPPNPAELLSSDRLQELFTLVPSKFDIVILDSPPTIGLADALILGNKASATILLIAFSQSKKRVLLDALKRLNQASANVIGFVVTKAKKGGGHGYGYDYHYDYYYSYGTDRKSKKSTKA